MSYSTLIAVYPDERTEHLDEFRNSHGTAPVIWEAMAGKYLGVKKAYDYPGKGWMQLGSLLWDLWKRQDIPLTHRAVFMFTFDRAYVSKEHYREMAHAIEQFQRDMPPNPEHVNHWPEIAQFFRSNPDIPGIGLYATSVSEDPFAGPWNEEKEEYDPPDWTRVYEIYLALASLRGGKDGG